MKKSKEASSPVSASSSTKTESESKAENEAKSVMQVNRMPVEGEKIECMSIADMLNQQPIPEIEGLFNFPLVDFELYMSDELEMSDEIVEDWTEEDVAGNIGNFASVDNWLNEIAGHFVNL